MPSTKFYDNPKRTSYYFRQVDFGAATDTTFTISPPLAAKHAQAPNASTSGLRGRVVGVSVFNVTTIFATATGTNPNVTVGTAATLGEYFSSPVVTARNGLTTLAVGASTYLLDDGPTSGNPDAFRQIDIPGSAAVTVTAVTSNDAAATGVADLIVDIDWY